MDRVSAAANPATDVAAALSRAADATGADFGQLVATARRESAFNPSARAATSSASGLFQFVEGTWFDMVRRHGAAHGLGDYATQLASGRVDASVRREILALRNDPEIAARMAAELTRDNAEALRAGLGREPTARELYAAHVLGAGGAKRLIAAADAGAPDASAIFAREAAVNRGLFYMPDGAPRSAEALLARFDLGEGASLDRPNTAPAGMLSPKLAHLLFTMALLPLLRTEASDGADNREAHAAYRRLIDL